MRRHDPRSSFTDEEICEAFVAFDLDKNHFIGAAEIRHVLASIGEAATDEEIEEMIHMVDKGGHGQVCFEQFYHMVTDGRHPPPALVATAAAAIDKASRQQEQSMARRHGHGHGHGPAATMTTSQRMSMMSPAASLRSPYHTPRAEAKATSVTATTTTTSALSKGHPLPQQQPQPAAPPPPSSQATLPPGALCPEALMKLRQAKRQTLEEFAHGNGSNKVEILKKVYRQFQASFAASTLASTLSSVQRKEAAGQINFSTFAKLFQGVQEQEDGDDHGNSHATSSFTSSPSSKRLFACFDVDRTGQIDLRELLLALSAFTGADKEERLKFAFVMFDEEGMGTIGYRELLRILRATHMASSNEEVQRKAETILAQKAQKDAAGGGGGGGGGRIDTASVTVAYEEFVAVGKKFPSLLFPSLVQPQPQQQTGAGGGGGGGAPVVAPPQAMPQQKQPPPPPQQQQQQELSHGVLV